MRKTYSAKQGKTLKRHDWRIAIMLAAAILIVSTIIGVVLMLQLNKNNGTNPDGTPVITRSIPNPLKGLPLYTDPSSNAATQATAWRTLKPAEAALMDKLAAQPTARWLTTQAAIDELPAYMQDAAAKKSLPLLVSYNIPLRDCGLYSAGGAESENTYRQFIDNLAETIGTNKAVVILEPDALAGLNGKRQDGQPCLNNQERQMYYNLLSYAVERLKQNDSTYVYIDAGNSGWQDDANEMARRLRKANIKTADGFSLNISNFQTNVDTIVYGNKISSKVGGKHFVIDTSRNGLGAYENKAQPDFNWCNPPGRALGHIPTTTTNHPLVDAFLYIKYPGESDGTDPDTTKCFGGPEAGAWWPDYAIGLIERWPQNLQQ